ncbi:MAG: hypothetical protein LBS12_03860 [Prevotellaceae bacterium]|jgi:hypothetical protein|nr:hypothetical protein [Prevotellaceae bacterium]
MQSTFESGHAVNISNFDKLIGILTDWGTNYAPPSDRLKLPHLNLVLGNAEDAVEDVEQCLATSINAINDRRQAFLPLNKTVTRVLYVAQIIPLNASVVKAIKELVRKIHGGRAVPKRLFMSAPDFSLQPVDPSIQTAAHSLQPVDPSLQAAYHLRHPDAVLPTDLPHPAFPVHRYISVSQRSFNQQIDHTSKIVSILKAEPAYLPAETDLTIATLEAMLAAMRSSNHAAILAEIPLFTARAIRNRILYARYSGLVDIALDVKKYVRGAFGFDSIEYAQVRRIKFHRYK